jgi:hypothetical protein
MVGSLWYQLNSVKTAVHELGTEETEIGGSEGGSEGEVGEVKGMVVEGWVV